MHRRMVRAALAVLAVLLPLARPASALDPNRALTQYVHRIWQAQQGLPQPTVYAIAQGSQGYLWLGTQGGLVRFDGALFTPFDGGLPPRAWVQAIAEDPEHRLWVGTRDHGLFSIRDGHATRYGTGQGLPSDDVRALLVDRAGGVWAATSRGVARLSRSQIVAYRVAQGLATDATTALAQAADGTIWIGGASADVSVWNGAGFARYHVASIAGDSLVQSIVAARDRSMWIGTSSGLVHVVPGQPERVYTTKDGLTGNSILALAEIEGSIWTGTRNGFSRVRGGVIESFTTDDGLSHSTVYAICQDREASVWVGTKHGLNQFLDGRTIPFTTTEGLPTNDTGPVIQDRRGTIWVGTLDAGLARFDGQRFTSLTTRDGLPSNAVRALAEDRMGNLWVGTDGGLARIREGRVQGIYRTAQGLPSDSVRALSVDRADALWIGTTRGAATLSVASGVKRPLGPLTTVDALAVDAAGRTFEAAGGEVRLASGGRSAGLAELVRDRRGGMPASADALYGDGDGRIWIGTNGDGLWLLDTDRLVHYTIADGLFDDQIYGLVGDDRNRLWMVCSKGVFSVERDDLLKFEAGRIRTFISTPYSPTDALRTIEGRAGVQPAIWRMDDGHLWISTIRGLVVIDPSRPEHRPPPRPVVEEVIVNGQRELPQALPTFAPYRNNITFRYTAPGFVAPNIVTFRYLLAGFDRQWTDAGTRREAFYTNLPHGSYRFDVKACNPAGTCVDLPRPVAFAIAPRIYERAWFFPLLAAMVVLTVWLAYQVRLRRLRARFAAVLAERVRIARELHDTVIQGLAGITMEMQALVSRLHDPGDRDALGAIVDDAGATLREARESLADLRSPQGGPSNIAATIARTAKQLTQGKDIRLKLHVDQDVPALDAEVGYNLVRIAQEAITNAVRHSGAALVEVSFHRDADKVELSVRDSGEGFDRDEVTSAEPGHFGMAGMRERASEIGGAFEVVSRPGHGTSVTVRVPIEVKTR